MTTCIPAMTPSATTARRSVRALARWLSLAVALALPTACDDEALQQVEPGGLATDTEASEPRRTSAEPQLTAETGRPVSGFREKVKVTGRETFAIKPMDDGAKLVDADDQELARYTIQDGLRVKVKGADDHLLGQVKGDAEKLHVEGPDGGRIFALQRQEDGDYKLETAGGDLLYKIKARDYGWKVEDAGGTEVFKVKVKAGKTSLRDASDATLLSTKDALRPLAMACLGLEDLNQALRVALAVRIQAEAN